MRFLPASGEKSAEWGSMLHNFRPFPQRKIRGKCCCFREITVIYCAFAIDSQGQTRLPACLSGAFCPFRLGGRQPACVSKTKNHSKIHRWQVRSSFAGAEMCPDKKRPAENTCRIVKGLDAVWAHFCPSKPCLPLSIDGTHTEILQIGGRGYGTGRARH